MCYNLVLIYISLISESGITFPGHLPEGTRVPGSLALTSTHSGAHALTSQINLTKAGSVPITPPRISDLFILHVHESVSLGSLGSCGVEHESVLYI